MKTTIFVLLLSLCSTLIQAQNNFELTMAPFSIAMWGQTSGTTYVSFGYQKTLGIHYHLYYNELTNHGESGWWTGPFITVHQKIGPFYLRPGTGVVTRKLPSEVTGTHIQFLLQAGIYIHPKLRVNYSHLSNANYGSDNDGIDHISFTLSF